jgi:hypothetical protein
VFRRELICRYFINYMFYLFIFLYLLLCKNNYCLQFISCALYIYGGTQVAILSYVICKQIIQFWFGPPADPSDSSLVSSHISPNLPVSIVCMS